MLATRQTRNSVVPGELFPPYRVHRYRHDYNSLIHSSALIEGANDFLTCCKQHFFKTTRADGRDITCIACTLCLGCPACVFGYIRKSTMRLGKWERTLYPFEMDDTHLHNAITKLLRDEEHFKDNWFEWVEVLECEAKLRGPR